MRWQPRSHPGQPSPTATNEPRCLCQSGTRFRDKRREAMPRVRHRMPFCEFHGRCLHVAVWRQAHGRPRTSFGVAGLNMNGRQSMQFCPRRRRQCLERPCAAKIHVAATSIAVRFIDNTLCFARQMVVRSAHGDNSTAPAGSGSPASRNATSAANARPPPAESPANTIEPGAIRRASNVRYAHKVSCSAAGNGCSGARL